MGGSPERRAPMGSHEWPEGPKPRDGVMTCDVTGGPVLFFESWASSRATDPLCSSSHFSQSRNHQNMNDDDNDDDDDNHFSLFFLSFLSLLFWCISRHFSDLVAFRSSAAIQCSTKKPTATAKAPIARNGTVIALLTTKPSIVSSFRPFRQNYYETLSSQFTSYSHLFVETNSDNPIFIGQVDYSL